MLNEFEHAHYDRLKGEAKVCASQLYVLMSMSLNCKNNHCMHAKAQKYHK